MSRKKKSIKIKNIVSTKKPINPFRNGKNIKLKSGFLAFIGIHNG